MSTDSSTKYSQHFLPLAQKLEKIVPGLEDDLAGARIDEEPEYYLASCIAKTTQISFAIGISIISAAVIMDNDFLLKMGVVSLPLLWGLLFFTFSYRPRIKANKKARQLEKELPYAVRHILIEVKSGISLYEAMTAVTQDYGEASKEFNRVVSDIKGGKSQVEALEDSVKRNKSMMYRRTMWQMINSLKSGADLSKTLETMVDAMVEEQKLKVQNYGEDLNPLILMYLMLAVIFPSLGATLMIVMSSFTGFSLSNHIFMGMLGILFVFQLFFLNLVKTKRPEVKAA